MKKVINAAIIAISILLCGLSFAQEPAKPIPITAEQAFDSVQTQTDPILGEPTSVALVDVRTRAEYFWVGAACQVDEIITSNEKTIIPDYGKVILSQDGRFLLYEIDGRNKRLQTKKVSQINLSPIAINIPYKLWDENSGKTYTNDDFGEEVNKIGADYDVVIFFCRSGGRSEDCLGDFDTSLFEAIYEIDHPDGIQSGRGGFEGSDYRKVYNGYRGFPERLTEIQDFSSVSWKDTGLPMKTSINPLSQP